MQTLMYHDVVPAGQYGLSGFQGQHANHYKLTTLEFEQHLSTLLASGVGPATVDPDGFQSPDSPAVRFLLSFDDGGVSFLTEIAPRLEAVGCRGLFFITTDSIGTQGFLSEGQLRELADRGHLIGSHTCSHPARISSLRPALLTQEWSASRSRLELILDRPVVTASIPGGYYSEQVAVAAVQSGLQHIFTSEPTARSWRIGDGWVHGRYSVTRRTSAGKVADLAAGRALACRRQWVAWNARKAVKRMTGPLYEPVRRLLLRAG
ncbi:MAG: polysaccharide deacetylase family protein [Planctomycetaceae bacterium]